MTGVHRDLVERLRSAGCVFAEEEAAALRAATTDDDELERLVRRRVHGVPLEHVLGRVVFAGHDLLVTDGVFVPRRRTEVLLRVAVEHLRAARPAGRRPVLVELCCGCAPVAAVVAATLDCVVHATDVDPVAVACARRNLAPHGGRVHLGDLAAPLPDALDGTVDVVVANAPFVPTGALGLLPVDAREHEPRHAHDGGADGLDVARRVVVAATRLLAPGGLVAVQTGEDQAAALADHCVRHGLVPRTVVDEDLGATAVVATRAG